MPSPQKYINWMIDNGYGHPLEVLKDKYRALLGRRGGIYRWYDQAWTMPDGTKISAQEIDASYDPRDVFNPARQAFADYNTTDATYSALIGSADRSIGYFPTNMNSPGNITKSEAMMANMCVVRVSFSTATKATDNLYSYLAPADFDMKQEPFVVVPSHEASAEKRTEEDKFIGTDFKVAKVHEVIAVFDDEYGGDYKRIVAGFNPIDFMTFNVNATKKKKVLEKLKKMSEELSSLAAIEKLLAGNPEAEKLLEEYKKL